MCIRDRVIRTEGRKRWQRKNLNWCRTMPPLATSLRRSRSWWRGCSGVTAARPVSYTHLKQRQGDRRQPGQMGKYLAAEHEQREHKTCLLYTSKEKNAMKKVIYLFVLCMVLGLAGCGQSQENKEPVSYTHLTQR